MASNVGPPPLVGYPQYKGATTCPLVASGELRHADSRSPPTCAGYATIAHLPEGAKNFTTIELKSNFLGTAKEGVMRCEAVGEHLGRTTQVWAATVFNAQGRKMALFRCTQMILA